MIKRIIIKFLTLLIFISCSEDKQQSSEEIKTEVINTLNKLYEGYSDSDLEEFTRYYQNDVIRMGTDGEYQKGKDVFIENWTKTYEKYEVVVLDYSQPEVLVGQDQVVTFNNYDEMFIEKKTRDTTRIQGTWIGVWKKQEDDSWKLRMTTWHQE